MDKRKLLILGGYGNTGRPLAQLLLQETEVDLVLAGRGLLAAISRSIDPPLWLVVTGQCG